MGQSVNESPWDKRILEMKPMVVRIAKYMASRLPSYVEIDDLIQVGIMALHDALPRWETALGEFENFASARVRGAMMDELRLADFAPRRLRRFQRDVEAVSNSLRHELGRIPTDAEMAKRMTVPLRDYQRQLAELREVDAICFEELSEVLDDSDKDTSEEKFSDWNSDPELILDAKTKVKNLISAIGALSQREQDLLNEYYSGDIQLKEIAKRQGVTESRVCQVHRQALNKLRDRLYAV